MDDRMAQMATRLHGFLTGWLQANPGWAYQYNAATRLWNSGRRRTCRKSC
jgi:hypothetical protein